jgi:hypothetical protein
VGGNLFVVVSRPSLGVDDLDSTGDRWFVYTGGHKALVGRSSAKARNTTTKRATTTRATASASCLTLTTAPSCSSRTVSRPARPRRPSWQCDGGGGAVVRSMQTHAAYKKDCARLMADAPWPAGHA